MKLLTKENLKDYVSAANILGCGGGGSFEGGMAMIEEGLSRGLKFRLADPMELQDNGLLCILGGVGGGVPREVTERLSPYFDKFKVEDGAEAMRRSILSRQMAVKELSSFLGEEFYSYIATETGAGNGVMPMYMAALEEKPCIDGDCCGRAKPEIAISTTHITGISITPLTIVTPFKEIILLKNAVDDFRAENIARYMAVASGGEVTVARCPARIRDYKRGIVPNQVSRCIRFGKAIRVAANKGRNPVEAFEKATNAYRLFEGIVKSYDCKGEGGFNWGSWIIEGSGKFKGHIFRVWFKNENLISWIDDEPYVTCPDLICIVDGKTGQGFQNIAVSATYNGMEVAVLGLKTYKLWRTRKGVEIFGPRHFGYNIDYIPMEKNIKV